MRKTCKNWALLLLASAALTGCSTPADPERVELLISAAASLGKPLEQIKRDYERQHPDVTLTFNLGASGTLLTQLEQGAPADLFWSAASMQMDALEKQDKLQPGSRVHATANELVLVVPQGRSNVTSFAQLGEATVQRIAIGTPETVPAGLYAKQTLTALTLWPTVEPKAIYAKDVTQVLAYVERGEVDAGLVYRSDAASAKQVQVVATATSGQHDPIVYPLAILKHTRDLQAAQDFHAYLLSSAAQEVLIRHGFSRLEGQ